MPCTRRGASTRPSSPCSPSCSGALAALETVLAEAHPEITTLRSGVAELQTKVASLAEQLRGVKEALGIYAATAPRSEGLLRPGLAWARRSGYGSAPCGSRKAG